MTKPTFKFGPIVVILSLLLMAYYMKIFYAAKARLGAAHVEAPSDQAGK